MPVFPPQRQYPKHLWRFLIKRRFVPLKSRFQHRGGIRAQGRVVLSQPPWLPKYVAVLYSREKRVNFFAVIDLNRRMERSRIEGRKNAFPDCPQNFWGFPYS